MTPEQEQAHRKLLGKLPMREHRIKDDCDVMDKPGAMRPICINGEIYPGIRPAARRLHIPINRIMRLLDTQEAYYL